MAYSIAIVNLRLWEKDVARIPKPLLIDILRAIRALESDPWAGNIQVKKLKDYHVADFRLRIGEYRVLFNKDDQQKTISLLRILHRSKLY